MAVDRDPDRVAQVEADHGKATAGVVADITRPRATPGRSTRRGPGSAGSTSSWRTRACSTTAPLPGLDQIAIGAAPLAFLPRPEDYTGHDVQLASRANAAATTGVVIACDGGLDVRGIGLPR